MTRETEEAAFQRGLADLLDRFDRAVAPDAREPFAGAGVGDPLEHTTRIQFLDDLVELLGWRLGIGGNVEEEARLRIPRTTFMDYLGVARDTNTPVLLIEAKAWDKSFITPQAKGANASYEAAGLIAQAIEHWRNRGDRAGSPAVPEWHDYLEQVGKYVRGLRDQYGHTLPRAVITSGQWLVVFKRPVATFLDEPPSNVDIQVFHKRDYHIQAWELYRLLSFTTLAVETPYYVRVTQAPGYITADALVACFHALHVSYEATGSPVFAKRPRILIYPALVLLRHDGALVTVLDQADFWDLSYARGVDDDLEQALEPHLNEVADAARRLLDRTVEQLGVQLEAAPLEAFPGYPIDKTDRAKGKSWMKRHPVEPDIWMVVTGQATHFVGAAPDIACNYHRWKVCHTAGEAIGQGAVSLPTTASPRSFFTDDQPHHCAHQGLQDRRKARCQIPLIDERLCCRSCVYAPVCWPGAQLPPLPCGR